MALITRISRLFKADFNAVLDQIEEPATLLRQAIREMEEELADAERHLHVAAAGCGQLRSRKDELAGVLVDIDEQLDICFESGKDELARDLIRRKLETERLEKRVTANLASAEKDVAAQRQTLSENRASLDSLRQKAELFADRSPPGSDRAGFPTDDWHDSELSVQDNDVEVAFLREKKRRARS